MSGGTNAEAWSEEEHDRFLNAIQQYPNKPWSYISQVIGTRSVDQVHTHFQKYRKRVELFRQEELEGQNMEPLRHDMEPPTSACMTYEDPLPTSLSIDMDEPMEFSRQRSLSAPSLSDLDDVAMSLGEPLSVSSDVPSTAPIQLLKDLNRDSQSSQCSFRMESLIEATPTCCGHEKREPVNVGERFSALEKRMSSGERDRLLQQLSSGSLRSAALKRESNFYFRGSLQNQFHPCS